MQDMQTTEASKMLEAALQQMDGIISSTTLASSVDAGGVPGGGSGVGVSTAINSTSVHSNAAPVATANYHARLLDLSAHNLISATNVLSTAKTLALALQQVGVVAPAPDTATAAIISDWLEAHIPRQDADERLRRLQRDKEALAAQFQALTEKVAAQAQKIVELERLLAERTQLLGASEAALQRQMLSQSALETQKLELMSALSELKLHRAALERENVELKSNSNSSSTARECDADGEGVEDGTPGGGGDGCGRNSVSSRQPFGSVGDLHKSTHALPLSVPKTPPAALRHQIHPQFHSLPRSHLSNKINKMHNNNNNNNSSRAYDANANASKPRNVAFASNEKIIDDVNVPDVMYDSFASQLNATPSPNLRERSAKGLRNIFGKLRRSNSGNLELPTLEQADSEFRRGGSRATAGGRIEWSTQDITLAQSSKAYADWSPQEVCNWLCDLGLGCYEEACRKWLKSDPSISFFNVSPLEIERELHLKSSLHRKKIMLAIDELTGKENDALALKAGQLDAGWVLRWLDDIGLPQYKDSFVQAKLDGRMLHRLTLEDLAQLHVTSCLHIASLRCAIQCMRANAWNPECLIRRSTNRGRNHDEDEQDADEDDEIEKRSENVALWTAHRVMEWLRVADLSEYAPNLRGAGVHGALMLYEARFNADLLADLLSIPPSKTLLRRHLATHFKELLGRAVIHAKRDAEASPGYQPLTIAAKIKAPKKTQFSLKRRKSTKGCSEIEWSDYVCPMTTLACASAEEQANNTSTTSSSTSTNHSSSVHSN